MVEKYYYKNHDILKEHLQRFIDTYNFGKKKLTVLKGLNVLDCIKKFWNEELDRFVKISAHRFFKASQFTILR